MKNRMKIYMGLVLIILIGIKSFAESETVSIHGTIDFEGEGTIFISLVDADNFSAEGIDIQSMARKITSEEISTGTLEFIFNNVPKGDYGIRTYIDENGNGILDTGTFGPKEPWGMSFKRRKPLCLPDFSQIRFTLDSDKIIQIKVD